MFTVGRDGDKEFIDIVKKAPFSVIVTFICFFSIWSVIGLAGFHTYLTTSDQTTNEDVSNQIYGIILSHKFILENYSHRSKDHFQREPNIALIHIHTGIYARIVFISYAVQ